MKFPIHKYLIFPYKIGTEVYYSFFDKGKVVKFDVDVDGELIIGVACFAYAQNQLPSYYYKEQLDEYMYYYT